MLFTLLCACSGQHPPTHTTDTSHSEDTGTKGQAPNATTPPTITQFDETPLARLLTIESDVPSVLTVQLSSSDESFRVRWPEPSLTHEVPLLGLKPARTWSVEIWLSNEHGETLAEVTNIQTAPLPEDFPTIDILTHKPTLAEPGYLTATVKPMGLHPHWFVAWDVQDLEVAWMLASEPGFSDLGRTSEGTLLGLNGAPELPEEIDFLGQIIRRWTPTPTEPFDLPLPLSNTHHELHPYPDASMLTISREELYTDLYPQSYDTPLDPLSPAKLVSGQISRFSPDGTLIWSWSLSNELDQTRISFDSLEPRGDGYDWLHINGAVPHPDGGVIVSLRNQDAIIKLNPEGQLQWILGDPSGWGPEQEPYLLSPSGEEPFSWPYHQHAPALTDDGLLVVFDNHNNGHTPYTPPPKEPWRSRVVAYRVDQEAMTVSQDWSFHPEGDGVQSIKMGDADPLPKTGHILANFGYILEGVELSPGSTSMRLVEFDPNTQETIIDIWLRGKIETDLDAGVRSYRSESMPSLYPDNVVVERTR